MGLDVLLSYLLHGFKLIPCSGMLALSHVLSYTNLSNWFIALVYECIVTLVYEHTGILCMATLHCSKLVCLPNLKLLCKGRLWLRLVTNMRTTMLWTDKGDCSLCGRGMAWHCIKAWVLNLECTVLLLLLFQRWHLQLGENGKLF